MALPVHAPEIGVGVGASAPPPVCLSPEKAKKFFEVFRTGSFSVIPLGDVVEQRMHFINPSEEERKKKIRGHFELCTALRGSCHFCRARLAGEVLIQPSQPYHLGPAYVRKGDRGDFEQRVITLTDGMFKQLCGHLGESGWRGHRFELRRESSQRYRIVVANKSHTPGGKLPAPFDVHPFVRARWELPQDPANPLVFLPNFSNRELTTAAPERPKALALTASDCQTAEEHAKVRAKKSELQSLIKSFGGKVAPESPAEPAPEADQAAADKPSELQVIEKAADPANYGPPQRAGVGTAEKPLLSVPADPDRDRLLSLNSRDRLRERQRRNRAAEAGGANNATALADLIPSANCSHEEGGDK